MRKITKIAIGLGFVLAMLVVFCNLGLAAADVGGCEIGLYRCMTDPMNMMFSTEGLVYCSIGYIFCKKYIEA